MQITRQADYAVRAVLHLARQGKQRVSTTAIAKEEKIPSSFLAKIISQLSIAGVLNTARGARGGVTLARAPEEITLLEVVEAIDGPIRLNDCVENPGGCAFEKDCPLQPVWWDAQKELVKRLKSTNFLTLMNK
ncbi:MAG: Rrf2 family transcriptional regulator [Anaerolineales bacterium]|nr:Rrf2 family transcriptional regulator [Anaerolineales bacterium]MCZ2120801.1 Rrf2 family transcriptional regulator [Anaerolineales bacterium]